MSGTDPRAGQEASRLLAAAQDWLRTSAPHLAPIADDGVVCSCPVCRAVAGLREADPDSVGRWVDSAVSALGSLVAQAGDLAPSRDRTNADPEDDIVQDDVDDKVVRDSDAEADTRDDGARQDGPTPRRVRRIPLDAEDTEGQDR